MIRFFFLALFFLALFSCNFSTQINSKNADNFNLKRDIIEQYFKHFNNHKWQEMADMYVDQPEMKNPAFGTKNVKMAKSEIIKKYTELHQMIPDIQDHISNIYYSGDNVIVEFESTGTAPDSSKFVLPICTIFEIKDGKISKDLTYYDNFGDGNK